MKKALVAFLVLLVLATLLGAFLIVTNYSAKKVTEKGCGSQDANDSSNQTSAKGCGTCNETAKMFTDNLKSTVDPCEDFYEFACGNFPKKHPLPDHRSSFDTFNKIQKEVKDILLKSLSSQGPTNEIKPLKYIRQFFKRMTDKGITALEQKLRDSESLEDLVADADASGISFLIYLGLIDDPEKRAKKKFVYLDRPWLTLGREDLVADESDEKAKNIREAYVKFVSSSLKLFDPSRADTEEAAKRILDLEIELAKITTKKEERRNYNELLKKFSKDKLSQVAPGFNLARVVDRMMGERTVDTVIVADVAYFNNLTRVIQGKDSVLHDKLTWKLISTYGSAVSTKFDELEFEFLKVKNGLKKKPDLDENVLWMLIKRMPNVIGRLYIDTVGFDEEDLERLMSMVDKVKEAMRNIFDEKDWMDEATKEKAKEKLDKMTPHIGYPKWIKNDSELIKSFDIEFDESKGNFDTLLYLNKFQSNEIISKVDEPTDHERDWSTSPAVVNAFFNAIHNTIVFTAAILRGSFYNRGCLDAVNYGAIGSIIGHEITHQFDDQGAQFGPDGSLVDWWSNETLNNFKKAARKMIDQYGSIVDEKANINLNGITTQGENIADNGGIRAAYQAYFSQELNEPKLATFEDWTPEKLFFLSYATTWCGVVNEETTRLRILYDSHSPNKYRVNVPLSNFEAFARAFECKVGSKMNPKDKVRVW